MEQQEPKQTADQAKEFADILLYAFNGEMPTDNNQRDLILHNFTNVHKTERLHSMAETYAAMRFAWKEAEDSNLRKYSKKVEQAIERLMIKELMESYGYTYNAKEDIFESPAMLKDQEITTIDNVTVIDK